MPVEANDRIFVPSYEDIDLRLTVDEKLNDILLDSIYDLNFDVMQVSGSKIHRRDQVLTYLSFV